MKIIVLVIQSLFKNSVFNMFKSNNLRTPEISCITSKSFIIHWVINLIVLKYFHLFCNLNFSFYILLARWKLQKTNCIIHIKSYATRFGVARSTWYIKCSSPPELASGCFKTYWICFFYFFRWHLQWLGYLLGSLEVTVIVPVSK